MKIMVYYLEIPYQTREIRQSHIDAKKQQLEKEFPGIKIMVLPSYDSTGDRVEVIDMTPNYVPSYASGTAPTYIPNWLYPTTGGGPYYTVTTATGGGVTSGGGGFGTSCGGGS